MKKHLYVADCDDGSYGLYLGTDKEPNETVIDGWEWADFGEGKHYKIKIEKDTLKKIKECL